MNPSMRMPFCAVTAAFFLQVNCWPSNASNVPHSLSIKPAHLQLKDKERIVGFELKLKDSAIKSLPKTPRNWSLHLENCLNEDPLWLSTLSGSSNVGAASLDAQFFQNFVLIEPYGQDSSNSSTACELVLHVTRDFSKTRKITLTSQDLAFAEAGVL